jgi:hypothetical protein
MATCGFWGWWSHKGVRRKCWISGGCRSLDADEIQLRILLLHGSRGCFVRGICLCSGVPCRLIVQEKDMVVRAISFLLALAVASTIAGAQAGPPAATQPLTLRNHVEIPRDARYTDLTNANDAAAGPDGRLWLTVRSTSGRIETLSSVKEALVGEFGQQQPELPTLYPILFEPGGRVWFFFAGPTTEDVRSSATMLLGYDGHTFIERQAPNADLGGFLANPSNVIARKTLYVDDTAFFSCGNILYTYGKGGWGTRDFGDPQTPTRGTMCVCIRG